MTSRQHDRSRRRHHSEGTFSSDIGEWSLEVPDDKQYARETQEFMPGAVIMLRLVNFQVTTDSTYQFGPSLNLVLGSNGTGKSTIINALFLLFRGLPASLERHNYAECIQHGQNVAYISAQIQGKDSEDSNPVITMCLNRDHPKRAEWFINNRAVSIPEYDAFLMQYHIQVNNLCQFLSQFRVAAFSGESAEQRLKSTEAAIGYDGIEQDHEKLASAGLESSAIAETMNQRAALITSLRETKTDLQAKSAQAEETLSLKQRVLLLENLISMKKYENSKEELKSLKADIVAAQKDLEQFDIEMQPFCEQIDQAKTVAEEAKAQLGSDAAAQKSVKEFESARQAFVANQKKVLSLASHLERAQKQVARLNSDVESLDSKLADAKLETSQTRRLVQEKGIDTESYEDLLVSSRQRQDEYTKEVQKVQRLKEEEHDIKRELAFKQNDLYTQQKRLKSLEDNAAASNNGTDGSGDSSKNDPNVFYPYRKPEGVRRFWNNDQGLQQNVRAVQQLQGNSVFEKSIILPAILCLNVTDKRVLPALSFALKTDQLHKFVCRSDKDQQTSVKLGARENLQLRTTVITEKNNASSLPPQLMERLRNAGFDGVISDYLDGPPAMLNFMESSGLGRIPVSFKPLSREATSLVRRIVEQSNTGSFRCADSEYMYSFSRSRYGRKQITEETRKFQGRLPSWTSFVLKDNATDDLRDQQEESLRQIRELKASVSTLINSISALQEKLTEKTSRIDVAQERTQDVRKIAHELGSQYQKEKALRDRYKKAMEEEKLIHQALTNKQTELQRESGLLDPILVQLNEALQRMNNSGKKPGLYLTTISTTGHTNNYLQSVYDDHKNKYEILQRTLDTKRNVYMEEVQKRKDFLKETMASQQETRTEAARAKAWIRQNNAEEEAKKMSSEMTLSEIRDEMNRARATVTLQDQRSDSPASIRAKLATAEERLAYEEQQQQSYESRLGELNELNDSIRNKWESEIRLIVNNISAKFSELFKEVGCKGYVSLHTPDPVAVGTWGIDIFVSFRPDEEPSKLSKMRQSGGERAVTTAIYLLSLQNLANAPFRVLDEINQGMDERNERITMKFFVTSSCEVALDSPTRQQYFLVTPKLISNMPWHKNMNIVFIFGGQTIKGANKLLSPTQLRQNNIALLNATNH